MQVDLDEIQKVYSSKNPFLNMNPFGSNPFDSDADLEKFSAGTTESPADQEAVSHKEIPNLEVYKYRVAYPGGTFVRISPHLHAEKAGDILECGTIIESTRSLFLDGVNYVYIKNPSGWIFVAKHGIQVLELVDVVRKVYSNPYEQFYTPERNERRTVYRARRENRKLFHLVREDNRYWRAIRIKCQELQTFDELVLLSLNLPSQPPSSPEPGPARVLWMHESLEYRDERIRNCITRIAAITRQSTEMISIEGLESSLWLFAHLGTRSSHALRIAVDAANQRFEHILEAKFRASLLSMVLDVGAASRPLTVALARMTGVDLLPDDIRNFLQRWVIIKCTDSRLSKPVQTEMITDSQSQRYPDRRLAGHSGSHKDRSISSASHHSSLMTSNPSTYGTDEDSDPNGSRSPRSHGVPSLQKQGKPERKSWLASPSVLWKEVEKELRKMSDPTVQFARLI